jgi:integrase
MPKSILTDAAVKKHKPKLKDPDDPTGPRMRTEIPDTGAPGLHLVIQPDSGKKSWAMRFRRPDGKSAKLTLGPVDVTGRKSVENPEMGGPLTLAEARLIAARVNHQRAAGADVVADRKATVLRARLRTKDDRDNSFSVLLRQYVDEHAKPKTRRWRETARLFGWHYPKDGDGEPEIIGGGLADRWADRPVRLIDAHDIYSVVDETVRLGVPGLQRRGEARTEALGRSIYAALSGFFGWLQRHRKVDMNPCLNVHRPDAAETRDRVLKDTEIVAIWKACDAIGEPYGPMVRFLLLTGARLREVAEMRREEFSDDLAIWTLPGSRSKNRRPLILPLPPLAREVLSSIRLIAGPGFMFTTYGQRPVNSFSLLKARLDSASRVSGWRLHDIRRTVATGMGDLGIAPHVIEACLNHVSGARGGIAGVYNRSELRREKALALEAWAARVEGLIEGRASNVVSISKHR